MITFRDHLNEKLKDKEFAALYETEKKLLGIAIRIAEERNNQGLSQSELAIKAMVTQQQVSKIENGQNCNIITFLKVSRALGLNLNVS
jgi:HTH-type transcriptional regulator / antitoxin HipB